MHFLMLIGLCESKGVKTVCDAMQLAAEVTATDPREMDILRREAREMALSGRDLLSEVKKKLSARKGRADVDVW